MPPQRCWLLYFVVIFFLVVYVINFNPLVKYSIVSLNLNVLIFVRQAALKL